MRAVTYWYRSEAVTVGKQNHPPAPVPPLPEQYSRHRAPPLPLCGGGWARPGVPPMDAAFPHGSCVGFPREPEARGSHPSGPAEPRARLCLPPRAPSASQAALRAATRAAPSRCCVVGISVTHRELPWQGNFCPGSAAPQPSRRALCQQDYCSAFPLLSPRSCYISFSKAQPASFPAELRPPAGRLWSSHSWL